MSKDETSESVPDVPRWLIEEIVEPFSAGVCRIFILHGDVGGLFRNCDEATAKDWPYGRLDDFLRNVFQERELTLNYDIASGFSFLEEKMEEKFRKINGLSDDEDGADAGDPVASAKASLKAKRAIPSDLDSALLMIEKALRTKGLKVSVVIKSAHLLVPSGGAGASAQRSERIIIQRILNWASDRRIKSNGNIVIMITNQIGNVSPELRQTGSGIRSVFIPKPTYAERLLYWRTTIRALKDVKLTAGLDEKKVAVATQGMHLVQILDILRLAKETGNPIELKSLKKEKVRMLNNEYGDVMEVVEPEKGLDDIGGLAHIKAYLNEVLSAIGSGEKALVPMGILLMGPPGTGKTAIVESLAKEAGFNFVKIKNLRSMWVGESEAKAERMMRGLRDLAPVVVMNDEADLAEAGRDAPKGDSGVSERLMKMWMEFLSDPRIRGQVIVISCTNRPDRIDAALKRSGRSDERIIVPMPSSEERVAIFAVMFKRHKIETDIKDFAPFAGEMTDGRSGADLEKIAIDANRARAREGEKVVTSKILESAIGDFISSASQADIDRMTIMAILESSSRRLLPPTAREMVKGVIERNLVPGLDVMVAQIISRKIIDLDEPKDSSKKTKKN